jgi:sugar phosphate isomerase/epimerase
MLYNLLFCLTVGGGLIMIELAYLRSDMKIAVQETMLHGRSMVDKLTHAQQLGIDGIEFFAESLTERVPEISAVMQNLDIRASAVNLGRIDGYLSPVLAEREHAISAMRQAMADAVDLGAEHVVFVPHFGGPRMPDLTPYRAPIELDSEMMIWLLRTVSDLAYAIGVELDMLPVNHYESYFMNRVEQAAFFRRKIKDHPHVKIAANLFHMAMEETDIIATLREHSQHIGYLYLSDTNRRLPGQGMLDFGAVAAVLREINYAGWITLTCADHFMRPADLPQSFSYLKSCGF